MTVFINRTLNMKKIKAIGFDMDYTLVRYDSEAFESFTYGEIKKKLIQVKNYPKKIADLPFDYNQVIQGLVIDKMRGNLLKVSRYSKVKSAYHGLTQLSFKEQQNVYRNRVIDLSDPNFQSLDTGFSISNGVLYAQLVQLASEGEDLPNFVQMAEDVREAVDLAHADGTLKKEVENNIEKYIVQDPDISRLLERYKEDGKKLIVITNSDYNYCKLLMDYAIKPFLKAHNCWTELFDIIVTASRKPLFFTTSNPFLVIDPKTGLMSNSFGKIDKGIYQGGCAAKLEVDLGLEGDEMLYLGDHIYGDVVSIKKTFNWRTALVLEPLIDEVLAIKKAHPTQSMIDDLMREKEALENELTKVEIEEYETKSRLKDKKNKIYKKIEEMNDSISGLIEEYQKFFNGRWGEMMRAGQEESRFADQVEKYACIYMAKVSDLLDYSPRTYFRPIKRILPHEK